MVPRCIEQATLSLGAFEGPALSREIVVAYSTLCVFAHHYPSQLTDEMTALMRKFAWVREKEPSRYLKQRRLALAQVLSELSACMSARPVA